MGKKIGTGELTPFKKSGTGSETIKSSVIGAHREGFTENDNYIREMTENVTKLTPFKTGPETPGLNIRPHFNPDHPPFIERKDNGIATFPAFSERESKYPKGFKGGID